MYFAQAISATVTVLVEFFFTIVKHKQSIHEKKEKIYFKSSGSIKKNVGCSVTAQY